MLDRSKVAFNAFWWGGLDSPDAVKRVCEGLAGLGYRGVEWKETCFGSGREARDRLKMAVDATRSVGMEVTDFVILRDLVNAESGAAASEEVCEFIRASADAGIRVVNIGSGSALPKDTPPEQWWRQGEQDWSKSWDTLEANLGNALRTAEAEGVTIAFETIVGALVHDYYSTLELLRRLDSPSLALTMDPSHYALHGNDIGFGIRQLRGRIAHVHMKDAIGHAGALGRDFIFPILGEGAIDWQEFVQALEEIGYDGWLSLEFESFKFMGEVLRGDAMEAARLSMASYNALVRTA